MARDVWTVAHLDTGRPVLSTAPLRIHRSRAWRSKRRRRPTRRDREGEDHEAMKAALYQEIGKLTVELDWLKKKHQLVDR
jgi:hypothetical protein